MKNLSKTELRSAGLLLSLGALMTLISILLETIVGWNSLFVEFIRTDYEAGTFMFEHWDMINTAWTFGMVGNVFFALCSILLIKDSRSIGWFPLRLLWSVFFVGSMLLILSFVIALGSYPKLLSILDDQLNLFASIRGFSVYFFSIGALFQMIIIVMFLHYGVSNDQNKTKRMVWIIFSFIIVAFILVFLGVLSFASFALVFFLAPFVLGIYYFKETFTKPSESFDKKE